MEALVLVLTLAMVPFRYYGSPFPTAPMVDNTELGELMVFLMAASMFSLPCEMIPLRESHKWQLHVLYVRSQP